MHRRRGVGRSSTHSIPRPVAHVPADFELVVLFVPVSIRNRTPPRSEPDEFQDAPAPSRIMSYRLGAGGTAGAAAPAGLSAADAAVGVHVREVVELEVVGLELDLTLPFSVADRSSVAFLSDVLTWMFVLVIVDAAARAAEEPAERRLVLHARRWRR